MTTVLNFSKAKSENRKLSMLTCYDAWTAKILADTDVDCLLVGDSVSMVMHGFDSTVSATTEMIAMHTAAVRRGAPAKFIVADMPFLSVRKGHRPAMESVEKLMQAGANAVKIEGVKGHESVIENIVESGVPVMGHLGLTPQSVHAFGGYKVQGKQEEKAREIREDAKRLQELGCFSFVLECVPVALAKAITEESQIPTIGIGAGSEVDGQVLVLQDLLGMSTDFKPKFVRHFLGGEGILKEAVQDFLSQVQQRSFPSAEESY